MTSAFLDSPLATGSRTPGPVGLLLHELRRQLGVDSVRLTRLVGDQSVHLASAERDGGPPPATTDFADTLCRQHTEAGAPALTLDAAADAVYGPVVARGGSTVRSFLTVPLHDGAPHPLGFLCASDARPDTTSLRDDAGLFRAVAFLLENQLQQQDEVEDARRAHESQATLSQDWLTTTLDRHGWDRALLLEQARCARMGATATVSVVKVLGVREANAALGQAGGDRVMRAAAEVLRLGLDPRDRLARTGGTEFALLHAGPRPREPAMLTASLGTALTAAGVTAGVGCAVAAIPVDLRRCWQQAHARARAVTPTATAPAPTDADAPAPAGLVEVSPRTDLARLLVGQPRLAQGSDPRSRLRSLLEAFARHLGMTVAYVCGVGPTTYTLEHVWTENPDSPVQAGCTGSTEAMYCAHMLAGRIPQAVGDTRDHPILRDNAMTDGLPIRSYLGAPVVLSDGRVHGSICAFRETPSPDLGPGDIALIGAMAEAAASLLEEDLLAVERDRGLLTLVDRVVLGGGPTIVFQPIVSLQDGRAIGMEALSRFAHARPDEVFAAVAAVDDGDRLQRAAVTAALGALDRVDGFLAVNLSARALLAPTTLEILASAPVHRLVVEVSEHEVIEDYAAIAAAVAPLRARGLRLAVDDAGSGFASLRHVLALAPEIIKLDIGMVRGLQSGTPQAALLAALAGFATDAGTLLIAEGVETAEELLALREAGVPAGQGYHFATPGPLAQP